MKCVEKKVEGLREEKSWATASSTLANCHVFPLFQIGTSQEFRKQGSSVTWRLADEGEATTR